MRKLIYATVSRTPVYRQMLCLMVKSLRGRGRYTGDIHIMCNLVDGLEEIAELQRSGHLSAEEADRRRNEILGAP
jgi:hypothetical protein